MHQLSIEAIDTVLNLASQPGIRRVSDLLDLLLDARNVALLEARMNDTTLDQEPIT